MLKLKLSYLYPLKYIGKERPYSKPCQSQCCSCKPLISGEICIKLGVRYSHWSSYNLICKLLRRQEERAGGEIKLNPAVRKVSSQVFFYSISYWVPLKIKTSKIRHTRNRALVQKLDGKLKPDRYRSDYSRKNFTSLGRAYLRGTNWSNSSYS